MSVCVFKCLSNILLTSTQWWIIESSSWLIINLANWSSSWKKLNEPWIEIGASCVCMWLPYQIMMASSPLLLNGSRAKSINLFKSRERWFFDQVTKGVSELWVLILLMIRRMQWEQYDDDAMSIYDGLSGLFCTWWVNVLYSRGYLGRARVLTPFWIDITRLVEPRFCAANIRERFHDTHGVNRVHGRFIHSFASRETGRKFWLL